LTTTLDLQELLLTLKVLRRDPLPIAGGIIAATFILDSVIVTLLGNTVAPYDPNSISFGSRFLPPSSSHLFGTDNLGRDIFSRVIVAAPIDAEIAFVIVGVSILVGLVMGSIAGYYGGRVDEALMRITDLFLAIPALVLAIAIAVALGPGVDHVIEANLISWWPIYSRLARAGTLSLRESQFVEAARTAGVSNLTIIRKHILPNNISPILVYGTLDIGNSIIYASILSYLGLGAQPPTAEWGRMVYEGQTYLASAWWIAIMPGLIILIVAIGFNLLGDSLRDAFDPRYRK
jgi:peptide/nickel transport system permease protein